eukprot:6466827-Amphidinium_carterae.1
MTWNLCGVTDLQHHELCTWPELVATDIAFLQEVCTADHIHGIVHTQFDGGWQMYQGGWDLPRRCAVLVNQELAGKIEAVQELSHGVMVTCRLQTDTPIKLVSAHLPWSVQETEAFKMALEEIQTAVGTDQYILGLDANVELQGVRDDIFVGDLLSVPRQWPDIEDERASTFHELLVDTKACAWNTWVEMGKQRPEAEAWDDAVTTLRHWTHPEQGKQVDYLVSNLQGSAAPRPWEYYSTATDHVPVVGEIYLKAKSWRLPGVQRLPASWEGEPQYYFIAARALRHQQTLQDFTDEAFAIANTCAVQHHRVVTSEEASLLSQRRQQPCAARRRMLTQLLKLHRRQQKQEEVHQRRKHFVENHGGGWSGHQKRRTIELQSLSVHPRRSRMRLRAITQSDFNDFWREVYVCPREEHIALQLVQADLDARLASATTHPELGPLLVPTEWVTEQLAKTKPTVAGLDGLPPAALRALP